MTTAVPSRLKASDAPGADRKPIYFKDFEMELFAAVQCIKLKLPVKLNVVSNDPRGERSTSSRESQPARTSESGRPRIHRDARQCSAYVTRAPCQHGRQFPISTSQFLRRRGLGYSTDQTGNSEKASRPKPAPESEDSLVFCLPSAS